MHEKLMGLVESAMGDIPFAIEKAEAHDLAYDTPDFVLRLSIAKSLVVIAATAADNHGRLEFLESRERERSGNEDAFCREMETRGKGGED